MAAVEKPVLLALYRRHKATLERVGLHKITLSTNTPSDKFTNLWARLCDNMAKSDLQLNELALSYIRQYHGLTLIPVKFEGSKHVKIWKGSAFVQSIKDITSNMVFDPPPSESSSNDDDDGMTTVLDSYYDTSTNCRLRIHG